MDYDKRYSEVISRLNSEQLAAVQYLTGPLLVLAGPGTGKTQLLSARVAYILKETDVDPSNILCVTFTDAGCQNMRDRLASMIGPVAAGKVAIHTYHTLGTDILHAYKNYSENYDRRLDSPIDEVTAYKIISDIQKSLDGRDILKGDSISDIISTIGEAKSNRLSFDALDKVADINAKESALLSEFISPLLQKVTARKLHPSLEDAYEPILDLLNSYEDATPIMPRVEHILVIIRDSLKNAINEATDINKVTPLTAWRNEFFEKDNNGDYRLKDRIAIKKLKSLSNVMAKYESYLRENGLYDFNDMIEEAIKILSDDTGFRMTLEERYQLILLDEFQDTNPSQFEIIRLLTDYDNPLVMAVGDDDQAIYEFQGAKASNLDDFQTHYDAHVINLVTNYRSTQDILDFSKQIIDQVPDSFSKTHPEIEKTLTAFFADKPGAIERHEFLSSDGEYYWIAERIAELIRSGVRQKDIAILTPKYKYITPLLPYLHAHKEIKLSYSQNDNILEDVRIHELITLARFTQGLAEGRNTTHLLPEILSFPFWDIDHFAILDVIRAARLDKKSTLDSLKNSENESLQHLATFLADLAVRSFDTPLETFMSYLIGTSSLNGYTSPFLDFYSQNIHSFDTFDLYEKLNVLRSRILAHNYNLTTAPKLKDFVNLIEDYEEADKPIVNSSPYQESNDAVSIMSAHKSKGLEFEHVFIVAADNTAWGKGKGNNNHLSLPRNLTHIRHTGVTDGERLRLLFVAITRARSHLYITNSLKDFNEKSPARLEYLNESIQTLDGKEVILSPFVPKESEQIVKEHYLDADNLKRATDLSVSWIDTYTHPDPDTLELYRSRVQNYRLSHSSLTSFIDVVYAGPKEFFKNQILKAPHEPETRSLALGNAIHRVFETITRDKITDSEAIELLKTELVKEDIETADLKDLLEKAPSDLAVALEAFGKELRAPFSRAEVDFYAENLSYEGVPLTGKIDHIRIDEDEKTIEVYDYKTSAYHADKWGGNNSTLFKYALQLTFYKLLLNLSPAYSKYTVTRAHILFVIPDRDSLVHDKVYDFDPATEELLKTLITKVYPHMTSLDFLDNPDYMVDPDVSKKLQDILDFIELL